MQFLRKPDIKWETFISIRQATMTDNAPRQFNFKAETKQLLHILIHSLYKDREVFLRELISNASDAINRLRFEMLTTPDALDPQAELKIHITADKDNRTLTITDTGIGMTHDEIVDHLGTIAQSSARKFLEAAKEKGQDASGMIGQFGVGFYSVFMVAEWVRVTSRSFRPEAQAVTWYATGDDSYEVSPAEMNERGISPAEMNERGTRVEIKLKEDAAEFAEEYRIKNIVHKHSDYIGFPIYVGSEEKPVNKQTSLWRTARNEIKEEDYKDFYRQTTLDFEDPLLRIHMVTDAPVQLYALLYLPARSERNMFSLRKDDGLKLYSRNILIDEYNKDLLPEYLRFVQGVVDSEDLPLNVSRETVQSSGLMPKLKKVLTNQVVKELENLAKKEAEKYNSFWGEFGAYLKQGIAANPAEADVIAPLLRFKTNLHPETWSSLEEYVSRMKDGQTVIHYLVSEDSKSALRSPHLDSFHAKGLEVVLLTEPMDSFMLMGLRKFKDYELKSVAGAEADGEDPARAESEAEKIPEEDFNALIGRFKRVLGERVADVRASKRLVQSVARLADADSNSNPDLQRVYKYLGREYEIPKKVLELNPSHEVLKNLLKLQADSELGDIVIEQIFDSALLVEGIHPDPSSMAPRVQRIIEAALAGK